MTRRPTGASRAGIAAVAVAATLAVGFHGYRYEPFPAIAEGASLAPLEVYEMFYENPVAPAAGHRTVHPPGHPTGGTVVGRAPVAALHVTYARLEAMSEKRWMVHLVTAEKDLVERNPAGEVNRLAILRDGDAVHLDPAYEWPDRGADFYLHIAGDQAGALAFARSLTDHVDVIEPNRFERT